MAERPRQEAVAAAFEDSGAIGVLGRGGQKTALRCADDTVIKVADQLSPMGLRRLERELRAMDAISDSRVVQLLEGPRSGKVDSTDVVWWREPYYAGGSLADRMSEGPWAPPEVVGLLFRLAGAMTLLEGAGLVHRDLKPDNIMFAAEEAEVLIDFGLVIDLSEDRVTATGTNAGGTRGYAPPEMYLPKDDGQPGVDSRSDQFSLGVVAYQLLTNRWPFGCPDSDGYWTRLIAGVADSAPLAEAGCRADLAEIICKMLRARRHQRFRRFTDLTSRIEALQ